MTSTSSTASINETMPMTPDLLALDKTALHTYFAAQEEVVFAYLFGSVARGQAGPLSDVDVAVLAQEGLDSRTLFDLRLRLLGDLMQQLGTESVDVVIMNQAPLALNYRVFRDGVQLYCRNRQRRVLYQADIVSRYLDFKPFLERYEHAVLDRAQRGELLNGYNPHRGSLDRYRQLRPILEGNAVTDQG